MLKVNRIQKILIAFFLIGVLFMSVLFIKPLSEPDICGEWEWIQTTGGVAGVKKTPATENYSVRLIFSKNGEFKYLKNGSMVKEGTYKILKKKTIFGDRYVVGYSDKGYLEESVTLEKDRLCLRQNVVDGFASYYIRAKQ